MSWKEDLKKIGLAGVGAAAILAEKTQEVAEQLVAKGESVVKEGKATNEELKRKVKETVKGKKEEDVAADVPYEETEEGADEQEAE